MKPEILVIGLDAATMDLIEPWVASGHLPALAGLMRQGTYSRLISTPNMHSASAWTSILTGLNPGRHGLFVFSDRDYATGEQAFFKGGDRAGALISAHLARHGKSSGLLNVPMTYPAECAAGGFMISGLDAPALNEKAFCPAGLREELLRRFPLYNFTPRGLGDLMSAGRVDLAIESWMDLIETQTAAAEYLLETRPVDFFMTVYTASDWAGHNLWEGSPARGEGGSLLSVYAALDKAVARLLKMAGERAQVYIISDHGMGPHTGAAYHLAAWLEERGYMRRRKRAEARGSLRGAGRRAARRLLPLPLREKIKASLGAERVKRLHTAEKDSFYSSIDWAETAAYTEPGRHVININLAGRNRDGSVSPGAYESTCERIIEDLSLWTDAGGNRVVERVARRSEVYEGPHAGRASDLYIHWSTRASFPDPPAEVRARKYWWSGDHRPEGILICKGPGIRRSGGLEPPVVYDLVPTMLYLAGLPVPGNLDGRVITGACDDSFIASHPLRVEATEGDEGSRRDSLTTADEQMIEEKLRSLGYL